MTNEEARKILLAKIKCEEKQVSGKDCGTYDCDDCELQYEQGNWGEFIEALKLACIALVKEDRK